MFAVAGGCRDGDRVMAVVEAGGEHGGGQGPGGGDEALDLAGFPVSGLEPGGELAHVLVGASGEGGDEVGDDELLFAGGGGDLVEALAEGLEHGEGRLAHKPEHGGA